MSEPIKLPRVSPENLVEGEWYRLKCDYGCHAFVQCDNYGDSGLGFDTGREVLLACDDLCGYEAYGPLPHFEIGE